MIHERLFKLEREAEKRVGDARDREIDRGGAGSARRASEAMNAPMLEVAKIRKMRQRLDDKQMEIDHHRDLLRRTGRNPGLPRDVKNHCTGQAETKLAGLKADFKELEAEAEQRFSPVANPGNPDWAWKAGEGITRPAGEIGRSSHDRALKALGLRPRLATDESEPTRGFSSGMQEPSASALPQRVSEAASEEEGNTENLDGSGVPQPDIYLGSLVPESESSTDKRESTAGPDDENSSIGRISDAVDSAVADLFEGPFGFSRQDLGPLVNRTPQEARTPVLGLVRTFNEILIRGGSQGADLAMRTVTAAVVGGVVAVGETAVELGMPRAEARRLMRDLYMGAEVAALELGGNPTAPLLRPRTPRSPVRHWPKGNSVGSPGSLIDQAEQSGILDDVLKRLSPGQRDAALARFRRSYDEGAQIGRAELRRRGLGGPAKPLPDLPDRIGKFVDRSLKVKNRTESFEIGKISDAEAIRLKLDTGLDLQGYRHVMDSSGVRHTVNKHGNRTIEAARGQRAVTNDDFARIPEILAAPDRVVYVGKSNIGLDVIKYEKRFNGMTFFLEEIRTGKKVAVLKSMWVKPSK